LHVTELDPRFPQSNERVRVTRCALALSMRSQKPLVCETSADLLVSEMSARNAYSHILLSHARNLASASSLLAQRTRAE